MASPEDPWARKSALKHCELQVGYKRNPDLVFYGGGTLSIKISQWKNFALSAWKATRSASDGDIWRQLSRGAYQNR